MPREAECGSGAVAWVRRWWRALLAEVVSTALLVALGIASLLPVRGAVPLTHPALAFAFVVTGNAVAFGAVSGAHMNPSVTLAALLYGQLGIFTAIAYALAQTVGAVLGFGALLAVANERALSGGPVGVTLPAPGVTPLAAAGVEALLTGLLALACCGAWAAHDAARPDHTVPVKLGLLVGGLVYAGGEISGASLNPARSLAPALLQGVWTDHWVYWVGPLGGAALSALLQRWVLLPPRRAPPAAPEALPLHDKADH